MQYPTQLILGLALSFLPFFELRGGLPIVLDYVLKNNLAIAPYFLLVLFFNLLSMFFVFFFLDFIHKHLIVFPLYKNFIEKIITKIQKKVDNTKSNLDRFGFIALTVFVAIPLPGTGAWTGSFVAWLLGLNRLKSYLAIAIGVVIAGILILTASLGLFSLIF